RKYGFSKYKFTKIFTDVPDLITIYFLTKYTRRPLHFFGKIGAFVFTIGFIILLYLSYLRFIGERIGGRPLLLFGVLLILAGMQIIFTGLLADLIVNINSKDDDDFPIKFEQN
ncbi:MAG: Glycosyl transferase, partial [Candidatus Levybacteria bacterium GW2011_GWB1_39_7]